MESSLLNTLLVAIGSSAIGAYIGIKIALTKLERDMASIQREQTKQVAAFEKHTDPATHPSNTDIQHLAQLIDRNHNDLKEMAMADIVSHGKIEGKIDALMTRLLDRP